MSNEDAVPSLKPCPFCGATPLLHRGEGIVGISCGSDSACNKTGLCVAFSPEKEASAIEAWNRRAPTAEQAEKDAKTAELGKMLANIIHDQTVAMQAAVIEWQHGKDAEAGFSWIVNTLKGPGHLPDFDAPYGKQAQFWFDSNRAEPFPKCFCGNPSHQLWMGQGFCCNAHYNEAKAKHDAAVAASTGEQA